MTLAQINWPLVLAGLGLFLFGIDYMGEGLKLISGEKLKDLIDKYTSSPLKGILIGTAVTCLIQSSSGTTALTIGLIRSGLMNLSQAVGIIMGANIGTVITAFLVGIDIAKYSVYFLAFGAFLIMFSKKKKVKYIGQILFGFGCLFYGLELMGDNLKDITKVPEFNQVVLAASANPWLGLIGGTLFTMLIQSSSAVIAIVQKLYSTGAFGLNIALPFLFGSNIGTTITAVLASFGGSIPSKRAAFFHVLFNITGSIIFMLLLYPFQNLLVSITSVLHINKMMQLAVAHGIFNIFTTILFFPFINKVVVLIKKLIPNKNKEIEMDLSELNTDILNLFPSHALEIAKSKTMEMGELTVQSVENVKQYFYNKSETARNNVEELENAINLMDKKISEYLVLINQQNLNQTEAAAFFANMKTIKDLERIGDLCINIINFTSAIYEEREDFSDEAKEEIGEMLDTAIPMLKDALLVYKNHNLELRQHVDEQESQLDYLNKLYKERHIIRVSNNQEKSNLVKSTFVDILANLERMGDHCQNISESYIMEEDVSDSNTDIGIPANEI